MAATTQPTLPIVSPSTDEGPSFDDTLKRHGLGTLTRARTTTLQVNMGKRCNQACHHCHVDAGPKRTEIMAEPVVERLLAMLAANPGVDTVDVTGGAPELNPSFRYLVRRAREMGRHVMDRCNLTVLCEPGMEDLAEFLASQAVEVVASLPCYTAENVDTQRGRGVFDKSIEALRQLCSLGYGQPGSGLVLNLVYNPGGAFLPPSQDGLQAQYRQRLHDEFGVRFNGLFTLANMPIRRFADHLIKAGQYDTYMDLLCNHFNPGTVSGLMCKTLLSVGWDGQLYDCDFNQMLNLPVGAGSVGNVRTIWDIDDLEQLTGAVVATASHCFGCTAGAGSSCGGALA